MARAPTNNPLMPADADNIIVSRDSSVIPRAVPTPEGDTLGTQQQNSSLARADANVPLGNAQQVGVSALAVSQASASIPTADTSNTPTVMTPLSRAVAISSTSPPSTPCSSDRASPNSPVSATPSGQKSPEDPAAKVNVQAKDVTKSGPPDGEPKDEADSEQGENISNRRGPDNKIQDRPGGDGQGQSDEGRQSRPGGKGQGQSDEGGQSRPGGKGQGRSGQGGQGQGERDNEDSQAQGNRNQGNEGQGQGNQGQGSKGQDNQGQGNQRQGNQGKGNQNQDGQGKGNQGKGSQNQDKGSQDQNNQGKGSQNQDKGSQDQNNQNSQNNQNNQNNNQNDIQNGPNGQDSQSNKGKTGNGTPDQNKNGGSDNSGNSSRNGDPARKSASDRTTSSPSTSPASASASISTASDRPAEPAAQATEPAAAASDNAPTDRNRGPPQEASQSQDVEQPSSTPTSVEAKPSDKPRDPQPEINLGLQDPEPASRASPDPSDPGPTKSQDEPTTAPSTSVDSGPTASPVETATSSNRSNPASTRGDTEPTSSSNPPPNFIPLGGSPKGSNSGSVSETGSVGSARGLQTGGVVGIAVGSVAAILLIGLLLWLWRKSSAKRRDSMPPRHLNASEPSEKGTGAGKLAPLLGFFKRGSGSRGAADDIKANTESSTAQFWDAQAIPRDNVTDAPVMSGGLSAKDRMMGWWARRGEDKDFNAAARVDRAGSWDEAVGKRGSIGAAAPELGLGQDPFSDSNAWPYGTGYATQLGQAGLLNPFVDPGSANQPPAIPPRAHGRSQSASVRDSHYRPYSMAFRPESSFRESLQSITPFAERRNKGRSDPFDLEIESRLIPSADDIAQMPRRPAMNSTYSSHMRGLSLPYSHYSSGISISDWSVLGPGAGFSTEPTMEAQGRSGDSARRSSDKGRGPGGGGGGVGQAL